VVLHLLHVTAVFVNRAHDTVSLLRKKIPEFTATWFLAAKQSSTLKK